jgi:hypothetical protein
MAVNGWDRLTIEAQNEIMAGALAIRRIRQHEDYHHWQAVGRGLLRLQEEAMHLSGSNSPHGRGYTAMRAELGARVPDLSTIDGTSKAHAVWLAQNFVVVEAWRATLAENIRQQLNHPSVIRRRYDAWRLIGQASGNEKVKLSTPLQKATAETVRLQEELDQAKARIRRLERGEGDMLLITRGAKAEEIAVVLRSELQPRKVTELAGLLLGQEKSTTSRPRGAKTKVAALPSAAGTAREGLG